MAPGRIRPPQPQKPDELVDRGRCPRAHEQDLVVVSRVDRGSNHLAGRFPETRHQAPGRGDLGVGVGVVRAYASDPLLDEREMAPGGCEVGVVDPARAEGGPDARPRTDILTPDPVGQDGKAVGRSLLAGRPTEGPASQQMQMNVKYGLAGTFVAIHNCTIPFFGKSLCGSYFASRRIQTADKRLIFIRDVVNRRDVFSRNDQHMRWCLRVEIAKRDRCFRFVDDIRRNVAIQYFAKKTV